MTFPFMNNFLSVQFPTIFYVYYFTFPLPRLAFFSFKRGNLKVSDSTCAISGIASVCPWVTVDKSVVNALLRLFYRFLPTYQGHPTTTFSKLLKKPFYGQLEEFLQEVLYFSLFCICSVILGHLSLSNHCFSENLICY